VPIFYDPLISKLAAWAEDRGATIARLRRALDEYVVTGIRTTVPFFSWLVQQPEFADGRFHTTYLDEVLASRNGEPFVRPSEEDEDVAALAAALHAFLAPAPTTSSVEKSRWKSVGRLEGLRQTLHHRGHRGRGD
jgi:acetyl-CoA carboxylase biotin carboxylase subunit